MSNVIATYQVFGDQESFEKKAEGIALGLTVGSWTDLPALDQEQLKKYRGTVVSIQDLGFHELASFAKNKKTASAHVKISYPSRNFSADIPAILTTVFGKLSLDGMVRLIDLEFEGEIARAFPGPRYGIEGIRDLVGVYHRPLVMSIFKGVLGRDMEFLSKQLKDQALGGMDLVKDDEILFDNVLTPFIERIKKGKHVLNQVYEETGHRTLYAVNLSGRTSLLKDQAKRAKEAGADAFLFNVFTYGLDVLQELREDSEIALPIMTHPSFSGAISGSSLFGVHYQLILGKLVRLTGADLSLFPSPYGSVALPKEDALLIAEALTGESPFKTSFPVPSAGIHPGLVPQLIHDFGKDQVINAGGGVHGHPDGAVAGGKSFRQAVDSIIEGKSLEDVLDEKKELKTAIATWGSVEVKK
ncbi:2,3-diketo-5-methylthiopentyl-1-phosphate enolase [Jeotgalibacillus soli]|uniref:2,3-diketo-5-methylthiopentyl-1-phosphate enolase n=1 Tax=Jeotgalibacillus soli TaxID=889306 RepID=A0A0C2RVT1_9BACL|nr:2,3-diketo-5-methylthiopentyl-1-phosphate enolase [Jeotgalibacillus soli]KIL45869.1 2,3-diketo-5-methylthiopentyl-1-phosphate enolase [Jeotgalibacillus soli]